MNKLNDYHNGHPTDAGVDIPFIEDVHIKPGETVQISLPLEGLDLPDNVLGMPFVRSKYADKVLVSPTVIDPHYTGIVHVWLTNPSYMPEVFEKGTEVIQIVLLPFLSYVGITPKTNEPRGYNRDTTR